MKPAMTRTSWHLLHDTGLFVYIAAPVLALIAWCVAAMATNLIPNQTRRRKEDF
jgi:hypothetical protein